MSRNIDETAEAPPEEDEGEDDEDEEGDDDDGQADATPAEAGGSTSNEAVLQITAVSSLDSLYGLREIGREALCWQLSSAKPGNGVEQIRDQSADTYWQSDGVSQPHWIQVHFARRVAISHVCLHLDYNLDESYTPKHLSVQVGMTTQDLVPAIYPSNTVVELTEPVGWCIIPLTAPPDPLDDDDADGEDEDGEDYDDGKPHRKSMKRRLVRTHMIRISIISMHQNGRDTHIRQVQLYGPRTAHMIPAASAGGSALFAHSIDSTGQDAKQLHSDWNRRQGPFQNDFATTSMTQFSVLR